MGGIVDVRSPQVQVGGLFKIAAASTSPRGNYLLWTSRSSSAAWLQKK